MKSGMNTEHAGDPSLATPQPAYLTLCTLLSLLPKLFRIGTTIAGLERRGHAKGEYAATSAPDHTRQGKSLPLPTAHRGPIPIQQQVTESCCGQGFAGREMDCPTYPPIGAWQQKQCMGKVV